MHIAAGFVQQAQRHPEKPAVLVHTDSQPDCCCYGQLLVAAQRIAGAIVASTSAKADAASLQNQVSVGLLLPNCREFLEVFLGTAMAGAVAIVFDPKWTAVQLRQVLEQHPLDLLFTDAQQLSRFVELFGTLNPSLNIIALNATSEPGGKWLDRFSDYAEWRNANPITLRPADAEAPFYVGFTSGTTGHPKGVVRSHRSWVSSFAASQVEFGTADSDRILVPGSLVHSLSLYAALECLNTGATLDLLPQFSVKAALNCLQAQATTMLVAVPTLLKTIAKAAINRQQIYAHPRVVIAGGSKLEPDLRTTLPQIFPNAAILEYFGALELSFVSLASSREHVPPTSVGRPFQGVTLSIREQDGLGEAATGEVGWIGVKSSMLSSGYWHSSNEQLSEAAGYRLIDGWTTVGDLGWQDAQGYLYLVGREQDMVISGGANLYPMEIEAILRSFPEIEEAAVFGVPDADRGQAIAAAIQWHGQSLPRSELQQRLQACLPRYKCPRYFFNVDRFPRTFSGKIIRAALRDQFLQGNKDEG